MLSEKKIKDPKTDPVVGYSVVRGSYLEDTNKNGHEPENALDC